MQTYESSDQFGSHRLFFGAIMDKKEQIKELLDRHELTLCYEKIFDRWIFDLRDKDGKTIWHQRAIDLTRLRDALLNFLLTYKSYNNG